MKSYGRKFEEKEGEDGTKVKVEVTPSVELIEKFQFTHPVYKPTPNNKFVMSKPSYPRQHLILSQDTTRLLEVVFEKG